MRRSSSPAGRGPVGGYDPSDELRIEGLQRIEPGTVFAYLPIKQGDTFTDEKASEAIRALYATGFFNDVQIATEGNVVVVQVQERPAIAHDRLRRHAGIRQGHADRRRCARSASSQGRSYDKALVDRAEQELKRQYLTRGLYAAEVTTTVTPIERNRVSILFTVAEGPSAKIRQINFIGNKAFSTSTLRDEMQLSTPTGSPGTRRTTCTRRTSSPATSRTSARTT